MYFSYGLKESIIHWYTIFGLGFALKIFPKSDLGTDEEIPPTSWQITGTPRNKHSLLEIPNASALENRVP